MKKEIYLFALVLILFSALYFLNTSVTGFSTAIETADVDEEIFDALNEEDKTSVIVVLKKTKSKGFKTLSTKTDKQKVLSTLSKNEFKKKHEYSIIEGFSGEVNSEGLEKLRQNPDVEKIYFDRKYSISLSDSVPLINASKLHPYQINNQNITGYGETICILDTGIDTDHPDFNNKISSCETFVGTADCEDDNGHGTHVSGIAAANGSTIGVAPDANISAIKVCDSGGVCSSSNILAGLEWCATNKDVYNISSISMSLGDSGEYNSSNCPTGYVDRPGLASAYAAGIFLTASSGNNHHTSGISYPACNENVTSTGATDKSDTITYNRGGDLLTILAPGVSITSTWNNGGTSAISGTSMSAPHTAGAAAILQQYAKANSGALTQSEIETALNSTGKSIYDSSSEGTYSRISIYEAIRSLTDILKPSLSIISPLNIDYTTNISLSLIYTANDINIDSTWYNINNGINNTLSGNTTFNTTEGSQILNLYANDSLGNENSATISFTADLTNPEIILTIPQNQTYATNTSLELNFSAIDSNIDSCWYNLDDENNITLNSCANTTFNTSEGSHSLKLFINDSSINENSTEVHFTTDLTDPEITLTTQNNSYTNNPTTLTFSLTEQNPDSCNLYGSWNGWHLNQTKSALENNFTLNLEDGTYIWNVKCNDTADNTGLGGQNYTITIDTTPPSLNLNYPENITYSYNNSLALNFSAIDTNLDSCWYSLNSGSNTTMANCENTTFDTPNEQNNLKVYVNDTVNNEIFEEISFVTDLAYPLIGLSSPSDDSSIESSANFSYTVEDVGIANCSLKINGTTNLTDSSIITSTTQTFSSVTLTDDNYYWSIICVDNTNRENISEERAVTICTENWNCTEWSSCSASQQTRTCTDLNSCSTTHSKPAVSKSCSSSSDSSDSTSESASGAASSAPLTSNYDEEVEEEETPQSTDLPEVSPTVEEEQEEEKEEPVEKEETTEEITEEEKGIIAKVWEKVKNLAKGITNPKQTAVTVSTLAVDGVKNHKIPVLGFVFVIGIMVFAQFYFLKKHNISLTKKVKEKIPKPNITIPPKVKDIKVKFKGIHQNIKEKINPSETIIQPVKKIHSSILKKLDPFKKYKDILKPKKPS